jgi:hypothetical protein
MRSSGRLALLLTAAVVPLVLVNVGAASATYEPGEPALSWEHQIDLGFDDSLSAIDEESGVVWSVGRANPVNDGHSDVVVLRSDGEGRILDRIEQGSDQLDYAAGVDAGPWGAVVAGSTGGAFPGTGSTNFGGLQGWVQLLDPEGRVVWTTQFGDAHVNYITGGAVLGDKVFVVGYSYPTGEDADLQVWAFSLDTGAPLEERHFGTPADDTLRSVVAVDGLLIVGGSTQGELVETARLGETDAILLALEPDDLSTRWARQFGTVGGDTVGTLAERDGTVYWAGALGNEDDANSFTPSVGGVGAVAADGTLLWRHRLGKTGSFVRTIAATSEGIVLGGGVRPGDLGAETASYGGQDAFLQGRAFTGEVLWPEVYGGRDYDDFLGLAVTGDRLLVAGVTYDGMFGSQNEEPVSVLARFDVPHLLRPDLAVRSPRGTYVGDNGSTRAVRLTVRPGGQRTTTLRLQDDGLLRDRLGLRSCSAGKQIRLRLLRGDRDVTASTRADTYRTPRLAPGRSQHLELRIRAGSDARGSHTCTLRARSASDARKVDRIELRIVVRR